MQESIDRVKWNGLCGIDFFDTINEIYEEATSWKRNLFKVPTGKAGQDFVAELTKCIKHFNIGSPLEPVALKMAMIIFPLLLQKPSKKSKAKEHSQCLARRLDLWDNGKLSSLLREVKEIQRRLTLRKQKNKDSSDKVFARLMLQGKVSAALRWIGTSKSSVRNVDTQTLDLLRTLHPDPAESSNLPM